MVKRQNHQTPEKKSGYHTQHIDFPNRYIADLKYRSPSGQCSTRLAFFKFCFNLLRTTSPIKRKYLELGRKVGYWAWKLVCQNEKWNVELLPTQKYITVLILESEEWKTISTP
jgi:hypothetical protein